MDRTILLSHHVQTSSLLTETTSPLLNNDGDVRMAIASSPIAKNTKMQDRLKECNYFSLPREVSSFLTTGYFNQLCSL